MTTLREAAQQALEALEMARMNGAAGLHKYETLQIAESAEALRAALAEPVHEPVYWEVRCTAHPKWMRVDEQQFDEYVANGWEGQRLYTAPPQRKPMNEFDALRLITESIGHLQSAGPVEGLIGIIRAVERAHGIT